jgi:hypothetical protein
LLRAGQGETYLNFPLPHKPCKMRTIGSWEIKETCVGSQDGAPNYPDVLGAITGGSRFNLDVVQFALAARPAQVAAGQTCELILLVQNASDGDVDVLLQVELPERDQARRKNCFIAASTRLRIGLRPAEMGFVSLPFTVSPTTQPASSYVAGLDLDIKRLAKASPQRVRAAAGGGRVQGLSEETLNHMKALRGLQFFIDPGRKKKCLQVPFAVLPPALASLTSPRAHWISLWTMSDLADQYIVVRQVAEPARACVSQLKREAVFMPLLKATQTHFGTSQYALLPPEAIFITKLLTLVLETPITEPAANNLRPVWPRWYVRLCRLLAQDTTLAGQIEPLVTRLIYSELVHDAVMHGFATVGAVTHEDFGSPEEMSHYADGIVDALDNAKALDFARAYLPLVMGGVIANARVTMPREQIRDTVFMLSKALEKRRPEKNDANAFIFDLTEHLIEQALDIT